MNLSPHFTLEELTHTEIRQFDNTPNSDQIVNLARLADFLEQVRDILGKPILVNSAFRSPLVNKTIGGTPSSQHMNGCAADIRVPPLLPDEVMQKVIESKINYDQLIREFDRWVHISIPNVLGDTPRKQALIIDRKGVRPYAVS